MIKKGDRAPLIQLTDSDLQAIQIPAKDSTTLLLFFPLAFTSVCTTEMCGVRDNLKWYNGVNARVFGISVDSPFTLKEFKTAQDLNFPLLSDFNRSAAAAYGAIYEDFFGMKGVAKRSAFVIDGNGVVQYAEVLEDAGQLPNFEEIANAIRNL
ncbi:MAG: peroxiredoxin [Saprospirales bacterium]|nr:MAG: peroxiredoxin [Saprospirales bacterium]